MNWGKQFWTIQALVAVGRESWFSLETGLPTLQVVGTSAA